ncbi:hypothetical protein [Ereboglobus luteus]|uniref:Rhamnogalacturonan lyase domain-containing protein n=1 Tax=Ereboglobus luteus TaxID=1796921 RepID=A0A2U8DZW4_9BACT|nr:hypothetical protein [Ereboglobus luteus]AWI07862.1 hypothetical protein CKA38_00060 [Ereboglobus luteus]
MAAPWLDHPAFAKAAERGAVGGRLVVRDPQSPAANAANAWVGLAEPSPDWQRQARNYQYWTRADARGNFHIPSVRAGNHTLYALLTACLASFAATTSP